MPDATMTQIANWPIALDDVRAANERIRPYLAPTALRQYPQLSEVALAVNWATALSNAVVFLG